jgi:hypothetical protein
MINKYHKQYNTDRLEVIDKIFEQINGQLPKDTINVLISDFEALISSYIARYNVCDTKWIIPNVVCIYNHSTRSKKRLSKALSHNKKARVAENRKVVRQQQSAFKSFMQQKLIDFFVG